LDETVYSRSTGGELRQGEILAGVIQIRQTLGTIGTAETTIDRVEHEFAIIVSQDCDLEQDFKKASKDNDRPLPSVLLCQVMPAVGLKGSVDKRTWDRILINKDERYQFLQRVQEHEDADGKGLPPLGVDFKRYFTVPTDELYRRIDLSESRRRSRLVTPYAEHLSARFFYYQSRVALPRDHQQNDL
jgi:hypothetical protein